MLREYNFGLLFIVENSKKKKQKVFSIDNKFFNAHLSQ